MYVEYVPSIGHHLRTQLELHPYPRPSGQAVTHRGQGVGEQRNKRRDEEDVCYNHKHKLRVVSTGCDIMPADLVTINGGPRIGEIYAR